MSTNMTEDSRNVRIGTPDTPDISLYKHLSEEERMLQGFPYKPLDPYLVNRRRRAHELNRKFNESSWDAYDERRAIIKELFHPSCGDRNIYIEPTFRSDYGNNIIVGNNFYANFDCLILDCAMVEIGDDCMLAPGVHIYTASHPLDPTFRRDPSSPAYFELAFPVKIGHTCWIGGKAIICPGVTIGDNVVIGAGAVVTKDVPSNVVVAGNPAKIIRRLDKPKN